MTWPLTMTELCPPPFAMEPDTLISKALGNGTQQNFMIMKTKNAMISKSEPANQTRKAISGGRSRSIRQRNQDNPKAASKFAQGMFDAIERLEDFPLSGRIVPEFADPMIRDVIRSPCRIVYRVKEREHYIEIARIWYAARGIPEI
ncbi:MAG TPA: hypothetical protein DCZ95_00675 [Verrucomicrobia bacterium]|nr:hypothetical protein [Verrucomicrobiota bacterium]